jgi:hypothetical protein
MDCFLPVHAVLEVGQEPLVIVADPGEALQQRVPLLRAELLHVDHPELALGHGQQSRPRAVVGRQLSPAPPTAAPAPRRRPRATWTPRTRCSPPTTPTSPRAEGSRRTRVSPRRRPWRLGPPKKQQQL